MEPVLSAVHALYTARTRRRVWCPRALAPAACTMAEIEGEDGQRCEANGQIHGDSDFDHEGESDREEPCVWPL